MSEEQKKGGFFSRLFGRRDSAEPESPRQDPHPPEPATEELRPAESLDESLDERRTEHQEEPQQAEPSAAPAPAVPPEAASAGMPAPIPARPPAEPPAEAAASPAAVPEASPQGRGDALSAAPAAERKGWWARLSEGLSRTSSQLTTGITDLFTKRKLDAATLDDLEDILIQADLGVDTAARVSKAVGAGRYEKGVSPEAVRAILADEVAAILKPVARPLRIEPGRKPHVLLMVGVNGSGKTTTIGKLAAKFRAEGRKVMLAAGDTFRAAAIEQLKVWGQRTGATVVAREQGGDAAGLAFDALTQAREAGADVLMIDTAGRLQNRAELMAELAKVVRVIRKIDESAPHAVLLVLDATVGQNAVSQVEAFRETAGVTGLVMTKLDGTARGGILVALSAKFGLPVHFIGVGEGIDDLEPFDAADFARAVAGLERAA